MSTMPKLKCCPDCKGSGRDPAFRHSAYPCPACDGAGQRYVCDHPICTRAPVQFDELTGEGFCAEHPKGNL